MIKIGMIVYQEEILLAGALQSIRSNLPEAQIILCDGAYRSWIQEVKLEAAHQYEYNHKEIGDALLRFATPQSTDRTLEIAKEFGVEHIVECQKDLYGNPIPWEHEYVKRDQFFRYCEPGDWLFVVDADERLQGRPEKLEGDAMNVWLKRDDSSDPYEVLRFYQVKEGMRFNGAHHCVWHGDRLYKRFDFQPAPGCTLLHLHNERGNGDKIRQYAKGAYYRYLCNKEEREFRAIHNI